SPPFRKRAGVSRGFWPFLALAAAAAVLLPHARGVESGLETTARVDGSESAAVESELQRRFDSPFSHTLVVVAGGLPTLRGPEGASALRTVVAAIRTVPGVTG